MLRFTIKYRFIFWGYRRHCEKSQTSWQSASLSRHCEGVSPWQSFEWCLAVTRLPRHFVPRSDESGGLRSQDCRVGGMSAVGYKKKMRLFFFQCAIDFREKFHIPRTRMIQHSCFLRAALCLFFGNIFHISLRIFVPIMNGTNIFFSELN